MSLERATPQRGMNPQIKAAFDIMHRLFALGRPLDARRAFNVALGPRRYRKHYRGASRREAVRGLTFRYRVTDSPRDVGHGDKERRALLRARRAG